MFTRLMKIGFISIPVGLLIMFGSAKFNPPFSGGIAFGILIALIGLILIIYEGIRD